MSPHAHRPCVCMCMCVCACINICVHVWRPELNAGYLPWSLSHLLLGTGFLIELGVHFIESDWLAKLGDLAVSTLPVLELQMHAIAPGFLCCCLVIEPRFSSFKGKHLVTCSLYPTVLFVSFGTAVYIYFLYLWMLAHIPQPTLQEFG